MSTIPILGNRKERRFDCADRSALGVTLTRRESQASMDVEPQDLSAHGLKILVPEPLLFEEIVDMRLASRDDRVEVETAAEVRWIRPCSDGKGWYVGLKFLKPVDQDCIDSLSEIGGIERRRSQRIPIELEAHVQLPASIERIAARVVDYSTAGIRLALNSRVERGQRLRVLLRDHQDYVIEVAATSKWCHESDDSDDMDEPEYLVGCEINAEQYGSRFLDWTRRIREVAATSRRKSRPSLLAVAVIVAIVGGVMFWLRLQ